MDVIQYRGSVDDIRCSLQHMNPQSKAEARDNLEYLRRSFDYEVKKKNRVTVIKMLHAKINKIKKLNSGPENTI